MNKIDREFIKISQDVDRFYSIRSELFTPRKFGKQIIQNIENLKSFSLALETKSKIDDLIISNLIERLELIKLRLKISIEGSYNYENAMREYGLSREDINLVRKKFESMNIKKIIDEYSEKTKLSWSFVSDENEIKRVRKILEKILKMSYQISPAKKYFPSFRNYMNTITFREKRSCHVLGGKVIFGIKDFETSWYYEGNKLIEDVDIFIIASTVGEEGLLEHQGHYLITDKAKIPKFMKIDTGCKVPIEIVGKPGSLILIEKIRNYRELKKLIKYKRLFNFLLIEKEFIFKKQFIRKFLRRYRDYLREVENRKFSEISNLLFKWTGDKNYKSQFFKRYFSSFNISLEEIYECAEDWVYLYRDIKAEEIFKKLKKFDEEDLLKILKKLYVGYWPKKTFEKYVKFILSSM
jgi:hypothetical protein